jgi:DNA-binding NtrC family response regulator
MPALTPEAPHLLVAEADQALRHLSQHALVEMGYTCTLASSLEQAQRLLQQQPFALVVTGTFSRTSRGALEALRPLLVLSHPRPVILCTGWPLSEAEVRRAGFAALVRRPFLLEQLATTVAACLQHPPYPGQPPLVDTVP